MARTISITKVGASTLVSITDTDAQDEKRVYNDFCNLYSVENKIIIGESYPHPELRIPFDELADNLYTADASAYIDEIIKPENGFFTS